ncbi:MAG: hypothetical protein PHX18_07605 [Candidatus Gastranaerophilales bacterium]|nr:hypothetical protein [Candidatus Gastranaerophilales bacterium]
MFDFSWSNILNSNAFNFILMVLVFVWIWKAAKAGEKIETAKQDVHNNINHSDELKENAKQELHKTQKSLENLEEELKEIINAAKQTIESFEAKTKEELESLIDNAKKTSDKRIVNEENQTNSRLVKYIGEKSLTAAKKQITSTLSDNKELHRKFISQVIDNIDGLEI